MSPHFGLMDESKMGKDEAMLMRAKLHWRGGMRRMRENKASAGLATLYDALLSAMRWYILSTELRDELGGDVDEQIENERLVFFLLRKHGVLDGSFDLEFVQKIVDKALMEEDVGRQQDMVVTQLRHFLTRLGVLPFDESLLPPEDPSTY